MGLSIFLAKLIGLYYIVISLVAIFRKEQFKNVIRNICLSEGLLAYAGLVGIIVGIAILIAHPIFEPSWRGLITVIGILTLIKGVLNFAFTTEVQKLSTVDWFNKFYYFCVFIMALLGGYFTYIGFTH
jgi:hypothetical protein